jgi:hypothetical protein
MTQETGQPEPARPATADGPAWLGYASQISDAQFTRDMLTARDKAETATPRLQMALTVLAVVAALTAMSALGVFTASHFRAMDMHYGVDAEGNPIGDEIDVRVAGIAFLTGAAGLVVLAGARLNLAARTRVVMMSAGATVMVVVGGGMGLLLDPSRRDLQQHYHVGEWGTRAAFDRFVHSLDALGWLIAACGIAVMVLAFVQRRRMSEAFPE